MVRCNGKLPPHHYPREHFPGFESLRATAQWTSDELRQLALGARHATLVKEHDEGVTVEYTLASLIVQAITHAAEHRAQIATIITNLGMQPPDMSVWYYLEEIGEFKEYAAAPSSRDEGRDN